MGSEWESEGVSEGGVLTETSIPVPELGLESFHYTVTPTPLTPGVSHNSVVPQHGTGDGRQTFLMVESTSLVAALTLLDPTPYFSSKACRIGMGEW